MELVTRKEAAERLGWSERELAVLELRGDIRRVATGKPGTRNAKSCYVWDHLIADLERLGSLRPVLQ